MLKLVIGGWVFVPDPEDLGGSQSLGEVLQVGNDGGGIGITNILDPVNPQDALTLAYWTNNPPPSVNSVATNVHLSSNDSFVLFDSISEGYQFQFLSNGDPKWNIGPFFPGNEFAWYSYIAGYSILTVKSDGSGITSDTGQWSISDAGIAVFTSVSGIGDTITVGGTALSDAIELSNILTAAGITPIADGTYTLGLGVTNNGTITTKSGIITAIQEAS